MITQALQTKIDHSIELLRKGEKLAFKMSPDGYYLAFSGGKDSQAIYQLAKESGVKFDAHYNVTTLDAPANVYFIREYYPDVKFELPKMNFFSLIKKKKMFPTMVARFCCAYLKEDKGAGRCVILGVRNDESVKRRGYKEVERQYKNLTEREREREREKDGVVELGKMEEVKFQCVNGNDKIKVSPILQWSTKDVFMYLDDRKIFLNPIYKTHDRVGCMFCPYASEKDSMQYAKEYPRYVEKIEQTAQWLIDNTPFGNKYRPFTAKEITDWYLYYSKKKTMESYFWDLRHQLSFFNDKKL
jgi:phosphoadenosine phosphosulfate reductase